MAPAVQRGAVDCAVAGGARYLLVISGLQVPSSNPECILARFALYSSPLVSIHYGAFVGGGLVAVGDALVGAGVDVGGTGVGGATGVLVGATGVLVGGGRFVGVALGVGVF